jgi:hypothetical protein
MIMQLEFALPMMKAGRWRERLGGLLEGPPT